MSTRYPGGVITKTPVVPAGPYETGAAPGIWTLDQQLQAQKAGIWPIAGLQPDYIEDVFSTYLYTGNGTGSGSTQTITNGINLSGKGGLVWIKSRNSAAGFHQLFDTTNLATIGPLATNSTNPGGYVGAAPPSPLYLTVTGSGFTLNTNYSYTNDSQYNYASWTFREQPKFFDIVTYTGDGVAGRTVAHNLGSVPGCMIVKNTSNASNWSVYHRSTGATDRLILNLTNATGANNTIWNDTAPTSTVFTVGDNSGVNASGQTYVAYLFAHNAGGFGLTGTDNVISCGSYTTVSNAATINLGYEPQLILHKRSDGVGNWEINDNMRGLTVAGSVEARLFPNLSDAESETNLFGVTSTGFTSQQASATYIYIAIRRGPMKVPTSGTSVFLPNDGTSSTSGQTISTSFPVDLAMSAYKTQGYVGLSNDRLRGIANANSAGATPALQTSTTQAESAFSATNPWFIKAWNTSITRGSNGADPGGGMVTWLFGRAPGFFDEVCWTGTSADQTLTHNLQATPELIIYKARGATSNWYTACAFTSSNYSNLQLNLTSASSTVAYSGGGPFSAQPTSTQFSVGQFYNTSTMVAYLFATVAGVSKVGSYTGTGTTQTINCGFTAGARFVLIKRTDSTGDWYVWDSARGIVAGNDPYLLLNSTAAEVTSTDYVDTAASGFEISSTAPAAINANGGSFIFLAIA